MSKYKFDVSLVTSGLSEGVFELQPSDYLYCEKLLLWLLVNYHMDVYGLRSSLIPMI